MSEKKKQIKRIQVPNKYIDNKKFDNNSFYLYVMLKTICVNNHVNIYKEKLLGKLQWTQYQFKKYLEDLKDKNLITYNFEVLPRYKPIEIEIFPIKQHSKKKEDYYTQVDIDTINRIIENSKKVKIETKSWNQSKKIKRDVKEKALRLFYLYEMYYNEDFGCAFIGYEKIENSMQIQSTYIKTINTMFNKESLVYVMIGSWRDNTEDEKRIRNANNYVPNCERIKLKKNKEEKDNE